MRQRIDDLEILGKYEQPRILLIDQLAHCRISLQAGKDHYAVQSWSVEDAERLVIWLGMWLAAETGNATFEAECATLRTQNYNLRAALAAAVQRAEAAARELDDLHVKLSCLPEYMRYCNDIEGPALTLAEWWAAQPDEVQP